MTGYESTSLCLVEQDDLQVLVAIHYEQAPQNAGLLVRAESIIILDKYGCVVDCGEED